MLQSLRLDGPQLYYCEVNTLVSGTRASACVQYMYFYCGFMRTLTWGVFSTQRSHQSQAPKLSSFFLHMSTEVRLGVVERSGDRAKDLAGA